MIIFPFPSPVKRLAQAVPFLADLLLHYTPWEDAGMGWEVAQQEGLLCVHTTPSTLIGRKVPGAPKPLLFPEAGKLQRSIASH